MILRKQNVPLPLTASEKLLEAAYFFNTMVSSRENTRLVPFLFSAYLTALNSTFNFLLMQHNNHPKFKDWFRAEMALKSSDPIMSSLHELRNVTVHHQPIKTISFDSGPKFEADFIETTHFEAENSTDSFGNEKWRYRIAKDGPWLEHGTNIRWYIELPGGEVDLLVASRHGLDFVNGLLSRWLQIESTPIS